MGLKRHYTDTPLRARLLEEGEKSAIGRLLPFLFNRITLQNLPKTLDKMLILLYIVEKNEWSYSQTA